MINGDATPLFLFYGVAILVGTGVIAYLVHQYTRFVKQLADKEQSYNDTEILALDEYIKRTKPEMWDHKKMLELLSKRNFRKKLEEALVDDFFKDRQEQKNKEKKV